ncbi:carboxypeptidase-like regulatory domain-containing protein [Planctomicrobium piriforme]|uniref:Carboxypeptidase regulatory-like domain-containing protein n=1 Tax=Planctomicrobium piriforme TaxID=1576369 RepID=A0A1I3GNT1_9PLAN|nr:carboxypeptidase-like regulatory domain-containing protein [Planctomicrobium piriforme]SFI24952.1 hypothetical protein SAMN05421753_10766 [Planctomicrobium piriforme]
MKTPARAMLIASCLVSLAMPLRIFAKDPKSPKAEKPTVIDLLLGRGGTLEGQLKDAGGQLADGASVTIWQGQKLIWKGTVDQAGKFQFKNLTTGFYRVVYGEQSVLCRAWSGETAPPSAQGSLTLNNEQKAAELGRQPAKGTTAGYSIPPLWSGSHYEYKSPPNP